MTPEERLVETAINHMMARWKFTRSQAVLGRVKAGDTVALEEACQGRNFFDQKVDETFEEYNRAYRLLEERIVELMELPTP